MITDSRVKTGVLTFGELPAPVDFSCQPTNVKLTPANKAEDPVETLCGDSIGGAGTTSWVLAGSAIQDFTDPDGFVLYCFEHDGETVPFSWQPNPDAGTWTGDVVIIAVEIGGDVNKRLSTDFTFAIEGKPVLTP